MRPLPSLFILALLLMPWVLGPAPAGQGPGLMLGPCCDAAGAAAGKRGSSQEHGKVKLELASPWLLAYVPIRSCHRVLKDKHGEFSPPAFHADFPVSFWCNWTIWAGSSKHIIIYIQGFITKDACNENEDKILFEGVSSLVENSVVYACWKKEMHVFATFAQAVHVVLLKRHLPNQRDARFKGKYYIFQDQQGASSFKDDKDDVVSGTSASKLPKKGGGFQSGWVENLRGALGFATTRGSTPVLSSEQMQGRGITPDTMALGSATELIPCERVRTQALKTKAPCGLGSELLEAWEAQGIGTPEGIIPTAAQDIWGQNPSVSKGSAVSSAPVHSVLLETPLLGAFQGAEPFWQPAGVSLESSQPVLSPTLRPKGLGHLQVTIKPTGTARLALAACSEPLSPGTGQSQQGTGPSRDSQLSTASLEKDGSHALLSVPAGGLIEGLMPSLRSPSDVVTRDHLQQLPERSQSSLGCLSKPKADLGTTGLHHTKLMDIFSLGSSGGAVRRTVLHPIAPGLAAPALATGLEHSLTPVPALGTETIPVLVTSSTVLAPADFGSLDLVPEAPLPPPVESLSMVAAALDWDPVSLGQRDISPASPGGHEVVSPSPPCHPSAASELGTDGSYRCLGPGRQKLVLGQGGETTASVGLVARSPSPVFVTVPGPGVRLAQPEGHVSRGSGVTPASPSDTREVHEVPVQHQGSAASDKPASVSRFRGFKMQGTTEAVQVGAGQRTAASFSTTPAHPGLPAAPWGEALPRDQKPWEPFGVPRNTQMPEGQQGKHAELGPPWVTEYFPIRSCHLTFRDGSGLFHLPLHADIKPNIWCNWTIWAGPQKHIVIYVQGFQGSEGCGHNQDKIIFQGVSSSVETKVVFACHNRGTLIFAARATEVQVLFLSGSGSRSHEYRHFTGHYYVFRDSETVGASSDTMAAPQEHVQETSKNDSWRTVVTKGLLSVLTAPPGPPAAPAGGRIQPDIVSPDEVGQHSPDLMEAGQSGANRNEHSQDETRLERNLQDSGSKGRETEGDKLVEPAPAGQDTGGKAEPPALELSPGRALVTVVPCHPPGSPCSEMPSSSVGVSDTSPTLAQASGSPSEVAAVAHHTQTPELAEPPLSTSTKSPLYPSPGVTAADVVSLGGRTEELFDLMSSVGNDTGLQSQHHPGDVLFEVSAEVKPKDWIPHGGSKFQKGLLESLKNHIQKNLKLSANRVSEIKLKDVKRTRDANLLLTFWVHLEPEERNVSLLLRSQLEELLGSSGGVEKLQLVSLFVEDVNECQAGLGLCGEGAECFNGVGTYLCRCKQDYEDRSPSKSGTLCIRAPRAGISTFLRHADMLVGAALVAGLVLLVAFGALCVTALWGQAPRRSPRPEEPPAEEPAMELHDLGECLQLEPFQLKLRARSPEWLWSFHVHPGQAGRLFPEQPPPL